jgi:hypothetical protein
MSDIGPSSARQKHGYRSKKPSSRFAAGNSYSPFLSHFPFSPDFCGAGLGVAPQRRRYSRRGTFSMPRTVLSERIEVSTSSLRAKDHSLSKTEFYRNRLRGGTNAH